MRRLRKGFENITDQRWSVGLSTGITVLGIGAEIRDLLKDYGYIQSMESFFGPVEYPKNTFRFPWQAEVGYLVKPRLEVGILASQINANNVEGYRPAVGEVNYDYNLLSLTPKVKWFSRLRDLQFWAGPSLNFSRIREGPGSRENKELVFGGTLGIEAALVEKSYSHLRFSFQWSSKLLLSKAVKTAPLIFCRESVTSMTLIFDLSLLVNGKLQPEQSKRYHPKTLPMLRHHFKTAVRNLFKRKGYTFLNITGLTVGMACCLIIALYVLDELHYDRFHEKADRIYRVTTHAVIGEFEWNAAIASPALATVLADEIPEIEEAVRVDQFDNVVVKYEDRVYSEDRVLAADGNFFEVFTFPLSSGDAATALREPASVVLTREKADKYFGKDRNPFGETLVIDDQPYRITGILEPVPSNSHIHFDIAFSFNSLRKGRTPHWENTNTATYFLLREGQRAENIPSKLQRVLKKHHPEYSDMMESGFTWNLGVQPLTDIHLYSHLEDELEPNGDIQNVYLFSLIAFFILFIACINFVNLATARSADRAREVGVRKTLGSDRRNLIGQFLLEAALVSFSATAVALGLTQLLRIPFNSIAGKNLSVRLFENPLLLLGILGIALLVTLLAGGYPAFYLSRFRPVEVLRGAVNAGSKNSIFRNVLVTFQFMLSIGLIAGTALIYQQLRFMQTKNLGLDKENVLIFRNAKELGEQQESFIEDVKRYSGVRSVSYSNLSPFDEYEGSYFVEKGRPENERRALNFMRISPDYLPTLGIQLVDGRNFSRDIAGDSAAIILNESAVRALGLEDPVDKVVQWSEPLRVVGVVKDYHFRSLHEEIRPLALLPATSGEVLEVRVQAGDLAGTLGWLQERWKQYLDNAVPLEYTFLDADFDALYRAEQQLGRLVGAFAALAIFIACLGLLGLAAFMAERRTKEIGIRKIMGASVRHILMLLSKEFTRLVIIAFLIASPLIYWGMNRWLNGFAYRIDIGWESFAFAGFAALLIAWLTVSFQSLRAARANPVEALRDE